MGGEEEDLEAANKIAALLPGIKIIGAADCMLLGAPLTYEGLP
jgi:hypothetical protein